MKKQYVSYKETQQFLEDAAASHADLIRVHSIGDTWEGRPILMATVSLDLANADSKPALLFTGTIHAREWIGIELATAFLQHIIDNYRFDPKLQSALARNTLYLVPCLNPDGFEYSRTHFSFWRKNRRDNGNGSHGVDLNRNFSVRFKKRSDTSSNTYGGPEPFSEPETRAIRDFVEAHDNIRLALDYHSQGNVFFPAHKFNHEAEIDTTDLNTLCANMVYEIEKVTGRKYGIHRGKPPTNLINGSGREWYYDRGILSAVVEVGTRNIPDYMENMSQSVNENIPALVYALDSAISYSSLAPARVQNFNISSIGEQSVTLEWDYDETDDVYYEIHRGSGHKQPINDASLVAITRSRSFTDNQLKSGRHYYYKIRAIDAIKRIAGPLAPELKLKTLLAADEFCRTLFPSPRDVGYVGQFSFEKNPDHFGHNSMFIGVNRSRGICYGVIAFSLDKLPDGASIKRAVFSLYPMNRVSAKIETYGEWSISFLDSDSVDDFRSYDDIHDAKVLHSGKAIASDRITQGVWSTWEFSGRERGILEEQLENGHVLIRIEGPIELPQGQNSQLMQFDIGYGKFGSGIHYRPNLEVTYSHAPEVIDIRPNVVNTIAASGIEAGVLRSGFDRGGQKIYGQLAFDLSVLPEPESTVITKAYLVLSNETRPRTRRDIRHSVELAELEDLQYDAVLNRQSIQYIGYEISNAVLRDKNQHYFDSDSYTCLELERIHRENEPAFFILRATSPSRNETDEVIEWVSRKDGELCARLVIHYVKRRKTALDRPENLHAVVEDSTVKLTWTNPDDPELIGAFAVRNRFHPPRSPLDGVKLYAGRDEYTYDRFGNPNVPKYYAVFTYDNVPNYSAAAVVHFSVDETVPIEEIDPEEVEAQEGDMPQSSPDDIESRN